MADRGSPWRRRTIWARTSGPSMGGPAFRPRWSRVTGAATTPNSLLFMKPATTRGPDQVVRRRAVQKVWPAVSSSPPEQVTVLLGDERAAAAERVPRRPGGQDRVPPGVALEAGPVLGAEVLVGGEQGGPHHVAGPGRPRVATRPVEVGLGDHGGAVDLAHRGHRGRRDHAGVGEGVLGLELAVEAAVDPQPLRQGGDDLLVAVVVHIRDDHPAVGRVGGRPGALAGVGGVAGGPLPHPVVLHRGHVAPLGGRHHLEAPVVVDVAHRRLVDDPAGHRRRPAREVASIRQGEGPQAAGRGTVTEGPVAPGAHDHVHAPVGVEVGHGR